MLVNLAICLFQVLSVAAAPQQAKTKSFARWCQEKNSVAVATRHTIDLLLKKADTQDCNLADSKLKNITEIERDRMGLKICPVKPESICKF